MKDNTVRITDPGLMSSFPKLKVKCRRTKNHFQVYFTFNKKQVFINKTLDGRSLKTEEDVMLVTAYLQGTGYKPEEWHKDKSFNLVHAYDTWLKLSTVSPEYLNERRKLKKKFIAFFGDNRDIRKISTMDIKQFHVDLKNGGLSDKSIKNILSELRTFLCRRSSKLTQLRSAQVPLLFFI